MELTLAGKTAGQRFLPPPGTFRAILADNRP
jgi:hypothetical protein